ncbi:MAG: glycosyltransferase family 4 protein [Fimbriimonadaceae bacterium]|nr:glycosyltransferase family 4 protein [Fimbriimonadaceae bacterium]
MATDRPADAALRIAFVLDRLALGGSEIKAQRLAGALAEAGCETGLFIWSATAADTTGPPATRTQHVDNGTVGSWVRLATALRRFRPDVIHTSLQRANRAAPLLGLLAGARVVTSNLGNVYPGLTWRARLWDALALRATSGGIAPTEDVRAWWSRLPGLTAERITVIPNPVRPLPGCDRATRLAVRAALGIGEHDPLLLTVAGLRPTKGLPDLLAAATRWPAAARRHVVIVGSGGLRPQLLAQAAAAGLAERVHLVGATPHPERWYAAADLYLQPSHVEGFALAAAEAMAAGLPVIATAAPGLRLLVRHGQTGWVVPVGSPRSLAEAVDALLAQPALAARLGRQARTIAPALALQRVALSYREHWLRLLAAAGTAQAAVRSRTGGRQAAGAAHR